MDFLVDLKSEIRISAYLSQHRPYYGIVTAQQLGMTVWSKPNFSSVGYHNHEKQPFIPQVRVRQKLRPKFCKI